MAHDVKGDICFLRSLVVTDLRSSAAASNAYRWALYSNSIPCQLWMFAEENPDKKRKFVENVKIS